NCRARCAGKAAVEPANGLAFVTQEFLGEVRFFNAQVTQVNIGFAQTCVSRQMIDYVLTFLWRQTVALCQRVSVRTGGPLLNFRAQLVKILLEFRTKLFVVPRRAGIGG